MAETQCPSCKRSMRGLPEDRQVKVTCTPANGGCGAQFIYPPIERSRIAMRCARDGQFLRVTFRRSLQTTKFAIESVDPRPASSSRTVATDASGGAGEQQFNADSYDWSAFFCACCGYVSPQRGLEIIQCCSCGSVVCGGTVHEVQGENGPEQWFECHPECGSIGKIEGRIQEFSSVRTERTKIIPAGELTDGTEKPLRLGG